MKDREEYGASRLMVSTPVKFVSTWDIIAHRIEAARRNAQAEELPVSFSPHQTDFSRSGDDPISLRHATRSSDDHCITGGLENHPHHSLRIGYRS